MLKTTGEKWGKPTEKWKLPTTIHSDNLPYIY